METAEPFDLFRPYAEKIGTVSYHVYYWENGCKKISPFFRRPETVNQFLVEKEAELAKYLEKRASKRIPVSQRLFIAAGDANCEFSRKLAELLEFNDEIYNRFEILNIGAHYEGQKEYHAKHLGDLMGQNVGEFHGRGILITGTAGGAALWANRHNHIRAAVAETETTAVQQRQKMINNVLVLPACSLGPQEMFTISKAWLLTEPAMGGFQQIQTVKLMTHRNHPLRAFLWDRYPDLMLAFCR